MKLTSFFYRFLVAVLSALLVTPGQKIQVYFENISAGTYRSRILTLRECQKAQFVLNFLDVATRFSPKRQDSILSYKS